MSLKEELEAERVGQLDLSGYCLVESGTPVRAVIDMMRQTGSRAALVTGDGALLGIFTERDVLRRVMGEDGELDAPIDLLMSTDVITITPDMSAAAALWLMDERHIRNLPIVDEKRQIVGGMTHAAIIDYLATRYPVEVLNRSPRPEQYPRKAEGG